MCQHLIGKLIGAASQPQVQPTYFGGEEWRRLSTTGLVGRLHSLADFSPPPLGDKHERYCHAEAEAHDRKHARPAVRGGAGPSLRQPATGSSGVGSPEVTTGGSSLTVTGTEIQLAPHSMHRARLSPATTTKIR